MDLDCKEVERLKELVPYKILAPTPNEIINYIEKLQSNWNSLREWLKKDDNVYICYSSQKSNKTFEAGVRFGLTFALDKMNELEGGEDE